MIRRLLYTGSLVWAVLLLAVPLEGQNIGAYQNQLREFDPSRDVILKAEHIGSGLAYVYVSDAWYHVRCYQRQRFAKNMRRLWRQHGGSNVVLKDRAGTTVADFKVFSGDFDVRGCD